VTSISCDSDEIHTVLGLLESHPKVIAYKLISDSGTYSDTDLEYAFRGYKAPAGKAVSEFVWKENV
jgi:hypothetical protein